ncbi:hypothetical protein DL765_010191 [Monosporascus sp. GIB2]|nr:hypothetical protein DL765_010191 [Monosporascus sp. GIB2]
MPISQTDYVTTISPEINWAYTLVPPLIERGFQPCYVAVPDRLFLDGQRSAEFVSHAVNKLADEYASSDGISIVSWSAGALVTQWTLTFYPETRSRVRRHIGLGPSYRGSWMMAPLFYLNRYSESVIQQLPWSNYLTTLRRFGGTEALVPTTNIGSSTDLVVQPSFFGEWFEGRHDSWRLSGPLASNVDIFKVCFLKALKRGRLPPVFTHDSLLWEAASHEVIFDALKNKETYVGTAGAIGPDDCESKLAPGLKPEWEEQHKTILLELFIYSRTLSLRGWPEVPLYDYASSK